ncbi:integrase [Klebsiella michiganensis]|uniref:tyrosine-type recombinase/integrase n=1 Tax=Klebsiella TaxID=570 RepID=UPI000EFA3A16|nr:MULTISPECIES: tyrosine-type recombinase/integrase [Klebsiella]MDU7527325.1 tyrosine-type recombinase/integrase [Klebsiella sp.]RMC90551.1 integrase [Klebsiella michiganensis]RWT48413.1 integrase [Klebsiella michiganensis]
MGRRRNHERRDLPPNLYVRNGGYYSYRDPRDGKEYGLGRNRRLAVSEAIQANIELLGDAGHVPLSTRISQIDSVTLHSWLERYEKIVASRGLKPKTLIDYASKLRSIKERMQDIPIAEITTKQIAIILNDYANEGKHAMAKLIRSTLGDIFREAIAEGHITVNPVTATRAAKFEVKRTRLTVEEYREIYRAAGTLSPWVRLSMDLAVLTGQRVSDLCAMSWEDIRDGYLYVEQKKTGAKLAIPVGLKIEELNISLEGVLQKFRKLSTGKTIISSSSGKKLSTTTVSGNFRRARELCGIIFTGEPPSFHELRSLSARLYGKQVGDSFAQHLLGHKSGSMTATYRDDRGREWDRIEIG